MKAFLAIAGLVALLGVPKANASIEVRIINVVGGVAVGDTGWIIGTGDGINSAIFSGTVGNYNVTGDTAVSHVGTGSNPLLDMAYNATALTNANPGTIIIEAMANTYTTASPGFEFVDNGNSGFTTGMFTDAAWGGNSNNICAGGTSACWNGTTNPAPSGTPTVLSLIGSGGPFASPTTWNVDKFGGSSTVSPYALGIAVMLANPTGTSTMSGDAKINAVPEPASVALLGGMLLFVGTTLRRRARRT